MSFKKRVYETLECGSPEATRIATQKRKDSISYCQRVGSPEEIRSPVVRINLDNNGLEPINNQIPSISPYIVIEFDLRFIQIKRTIVYFT